MKKKIDTQHERFGWTTNMSLVLTRSPLLRRELTTAERMSAHESQCERDKSNILLLKITITTKTTRNE